MAAIAGPEKLPHPRAPRSRAKPQGGRVGENCPSRAAGAAKARQNRHAQLLGKCNCRQGSHSEPRCRLKPFPGRSRCPTVGASPAASAPWLSFLRLRNCPTRPPLSLPAHTGRLCCARAKAPPTRPQRQTAKLQVKVAAHGVACEGGAWECKGRSLARGSASLAAIVWLSALWR